jgi:hypothetical protein
VKRHVYALALEGETETPSYTVTISCLTCQSTCSLTTQELDTALGFMYNLIETRED